MKQDRIDQSRIVTTWGPEVLRPWCGWGDRGSP